MKKIVYLIIALLTVTGCASSRLGIDTSSKCKHAIDGLECDRKQVWQMRDVVGVPVKQDHTMFWFKTQEDCLDFAKNSEKREELGIYTDDYVLNCGASGKFETSASVNNFYIYSDGVVDGDFYYIAPSGAVVENKKTNVREGFTPLFTSKSALYRFHHIGYQGLSVARGLSLGYAERIKVKKIE